MTQIIILIAARQISILSSIVYSHTVFTSFTWVKVAIPQCKKKNVKKTCIKKKENINISKMYVAEMKMQYYYVTEFWLKMHVHNEV